MCVVNTSENNIFWDFMNFQIIIRKREQREHILEKNVSTHALKSNLQNKVALITHSFAESYLPYHFTKQI